MLDNIERRIYIDTEPYHLPILQCWSKGEKYQKSSRFFQESENWTFNPNIQYNDKKVEQHGIIGMLIIDCMHDPKTNIRKITKRRFVQLVGEYATKENFLKEIEGMTHVLCYHGRLKPDWRGYVGFDYGVLKHNFGIQLDDLPNVKSEDLELVCHRNKLYGGQKGVEIQLGFTNRESGVDNHTDVNRIMYQLLTLELNEDKKLQYKLMKYHLLYNKDDVRGMVFIDQKLNNIRFIQDQNSIIEKDDIKCKMLEDNRYDDNDTLLRCDQCGYYYLKSRNNCQICENRFWKEEDDDDEDPDNIR